MREIFASSGDLYLVFSGPDGRVEFRHVDDDSSEEFNEWWPRLEAVRALPDANLSEDASARYRRFQGIAISLALEGSFDAASDMLETCHEFVRASHERVSRSMHVIGVVVGGVALLSLAAFLWPAGLTQRETIEFDGVVALALLGGTIGAALSSLSSRSSDIHFDPDSERKAAFLNGCLRPVYGSLCAAVVLIAIRSGFITSSVVEQARVFFPYLMLAIAAGFAERMAIDLIAVIRKSGQ